MTPNCKYQHAFFDYASAANEIFNCDEPALESGHCIFHDRVFATDIQNSSILKDRLQSKIRQNISGKNKLLCIGYHIPEIDVHVTFPNDAKFHFNALTS